MKKAKQERLFSKAIAGIAHSPLYRFNDEVKKRQEAGDDIISLGLGQPDEKTPPEIELAGIRAVKSNTGYICSIGSLALRKLIAAKYGVLPANVAVSSGGKAVIGAVYSCLLNKGDSLILPQPFWPPFRDIAVFLGARIIPIETKAKNFLLTAADVHRIVTKERNTPAAIIINSPNNPTGASYDLEELKKIAEICRARNIQVISDECYVRFSENSDFTFLDFCPSAVIIQSFSKSHAMPGWRIGWGIMPFQLAEKVKIYLDNFVGCPCAISDQAAIKAVSSPPISDYAEQRKMICFWLKEMELDYPEIIAGFYVFPDFSRLMKRLGIKDSVGLARYFLDRVGVACIPGAAFGPYDTHLRLSYCLKADRLRLALDRIGSVLND